MQAQTFVGKVSIEALKAMDDHINQWLDKNRVKPKNITQTFGYERHNHSDEQEPVIITTIWY